MWSTFKGPLIFKTSQDNLVVVLDTNEAIREDEAMRPAIEIDHETHHLLNKKVGFS